VSKISVVLLSKKLTLKEDAPGKQIARDRVDPIPRPIALNLRIDVRAGDTGQRRRSVAAQ
jgi:hypothetical protein